MSFNVLSAYFLNLFMHGINIGYCVKPGVGATARQDFETVADGYFKTLVCPIFLI